MDVLILVKVGEAAALFALAMGAVLGLLVCLKAVKRFFHSAFNLLTNISSCFAGGIFLAAGFVHLIPDAVDSLDADNNIKIILFSSVVITILALLFAEKILVPGVVIFLARIGIMRIIHRWLFQSKDNETTKLIEKDVENPGERKTQSKKTRASIEDSLAGDSSDDSNSDSTKKSKETSYSLDEEDKGEESSGDETNAITSKVIEETNSQESKSNSSRNSEKKAKTREKKSKKLRMRNKQASPSEETSPPGQSHGGHFHVGHSHGIRKGNTQPASKDVEVLNSEFSAIDSSMLAMVLVVALSGHSFFEGLAIGLAQSLEFSTVAFVAVLAHKGFAVGSVAMELYQSDLRLLISLTCLTFISLMSPVGILLGTLIDAVGSDNSGQIEAFFNAIAAGSFVYIGMGELGHHLEFNLADNNFLTVLISWAFAVIGFSGMALLALWA